MPLTHGMDVEAVEALGALLQQRSEQLRQISAEIERRLAGSAWNGPDGQAFRQQAWPAGRGRLTQVAADLHGFGQSALNNAAEQRQASGVSGGSTGGAALGAALLPAAWATMSAADRARHLMRVGWAEGDRLWAGLSAADRSALAARLHAEGELSILPPRLRYEINRQLVQGELDRLRKDWFKNAGEKHRIDLYERILRDNEQVLFFDPGGDGRIAVVQGDLSTAQGIAVQVPGISNNLDSYWGLLDDGHRLAGAAGGDVAVVTWLGYDAPVGVGLNPFRDIAEIGTPALAEGGAVALRSFVSNLDQARPNAHITVIGHSYGSLVTGMAATDGLAADDVVLIGSPGTGAPDVGAFAHEGSRPTVHVGYVTDDAVPSLADLDRPGSGAGTFGTIPYDDHFGADEVRFFGKSDGVNPHSSYYLDGSSQLRWLAQIANGGDGG